MTANPSAMETVVQPQEPAACRAGQPQLAPSSQLPARCFVLFVLPLLVTLLCLAWAGSGPRSASFAGRPPSSLPLWVPRGGRSWYTCPLFWLLPSSPLLLSKTASPWAQLVPSGRWRGTPRDGHPGWLGFPLWTAPCLHPRPCQSSFLASRASLLLWPSVSGGGEQKPALCFPGCQASEKFRPQRRTGTPFFCPPRPLSREGAAPSLQAGFLLQ